MSNIEIFSKFLNLLSEFFFGIGHTVIIGLKGDAAGRRDKKVTALQIVNFVHTEIMRIRQEQPKYTQRPAAIPSGSDLTRLAFPLTTIKD